MRVRNTALYGEDPIEKDDTAFFLYFFSVTK